MKRLLAIILSLAMLLSACSSQGNDSNKTQESTESEPVVTESENVQNNAESVSTQEAGNDTNVKKDDGLDFTVKGLDDEKLLSYVEDSVYEDLVNQLDSEDYFVENVEAIYYPKEYIEALASNSQSNIYFGFTSAELEEQFQGTRYVFTLGEDGQTVVVPMETINDDVYVKALEDVIVGTGVILVCVTVSVVSAPAAPAVSMIFMASASTGTAFALETGTLSFAAAAIAKGYETESFDQVLKAGVEAGGEGYKWGAISGVIYGGGKEAIALKGATLNGLTMNEAAMIQKESGFPLELIKQFKSYEEYTIYKEAGLYTKMINGKLALVRNIDLEYVSELPSGEKVTNLVRMQKGYAPLDPATGKAYQLHHINQDPNGTLAILTEAEHQGNSSILNIFGKESEIDRKAFETVRKEFWQKYAASLL